MPDGQNLSMESMVIETPLGSAPDIRLTALEGEDVLSRCFSYRATIVTTRSADALDGLIGEAVTLWFTAGGKETHRPINGHVRRVRGCGVTHRGVGQYELEIVPRLWFLSCTQDSRIFQHLSAPDIIKQVFEDHGLSHFKFKITGADYPKLDYCVQYRETGLAFVSRLMEHYGLFYWHEHEAGQHTLMIGGANRATGKCEPYEVRLNPQEAFGELQTLEIDYAFRPGKWTLNDYDFESPTKQLLVDTPALSGTPRMVDHEIYDYPGQFTDPDEGRKLSRLRIELEEAQHRRVFGRSACVFFDPGRRFELEAGHEQTAYLLTEVRHSAKFVPSETGQAEKYHYGNEYVAIPAAHEFRPERITPLPLIQGNQTATVVGPAGEAIHCDEYGRVRVQFHWDRRGKRDADSSCWVRVAQARSGSYYGTMVIPHVGHEVLVSFIEGNPNRPLIIGTVPNALTMPPVPLPGGKHKTVQRDHGNNKMVMHGKAGGEFLSLSSPKTINLFASGHHARPLSADALPFAGLGGSTVTVNGFQDPNSLQTLLSHWNSVYQSDTGAANAGPTNDSGGTYINSGTEGVSNSLVIGNSNSWVYANQNSWVNGNSASQVNGNLVTTVGGFAYGGSSASSLSSLEVYGTNKTLVHGDNITIADNLNFTQATTNVTQATTNTTQATTNLTMVLGDNSQYVYGANDSLTCVTNDQINIGLNTQFNLMGNLAYNGGYNTQINQGLNLTINTGTSVAMTTGINVQIKVAGSEQTNIEMSEIGSKLTSGGAGITSFLMKLFT
jgi:type VI secretion system secreted protein VgrG